MRVAVNDGQNDEQYRKVTEGERKARAVAAQMAQERRMDYPTLVGEYSSESDESRKRRLLSLIGKENPYYYKDISSRENMLNTAYRGKVLQEGKVKTLGQSFQDTQDRLRRENQVLKKRYGVTQAILSIKKDRERELDALYSTFTANPTQDAYSEYQRKYGEYDRWLNSAGVKNHFSNYNQQLQIMDELLAGAEEAAGAYREAVDQYNLAQNAYAKSLVSYAWNGSDSRQNMINLTPRARTDLANYKEKAYAKEKTAAENRIAEIDWEMQQNADEARKNSAAGMDTEALAAKQAPLAAERQKLENDLYNLDRYGEAMRMEQEALNDPEFQKYAREGQKRIEANYDIVRRNHGDTSWFEEYNAMSPRQKEVYNYYAGKKGDSAAQAYKTQLQMDIHAAMADEYMKRILKGAKQDPAGYGLASVFTTPIAAAYTAADMVSGGFESLFKPKGQHDHYADPNTRGQMMLRGNQLARQVGLEQIKNPALRGAAELGYISADMTPMVAMSVAGLLGLGKAYMGMLEGTGNYADVTRRGVPQGQALAYGVTSGLVSAAMEGIGLDNIAKAFAGGKHTATQIIRGMLGSFAAEGSEEAAENLAQVVYDRVINGTKSSREMAKRQYMDEGLSEEEAEKKSWEDISVETWKSFLMGGLAGGIMSGGGYLGSAALNEIANVSSNHRNENALTQLRNVLIDCGLTGQQADELINTSAVLHTSANPYANAEMNVEAQQELRGLLVDGGVLTEEQFDTLIESQGWQNENAAAHAAQQPQYSLNAFEDGKRFVDVQTDQALFDGLTASEQSKLAEKVIKERFAGKVVGIDNPVFVNGHTAGEYGHPAKRIENEIREAKARASTELDNLIDAGFDFRTEPDGKDGHIHPSAIGGFSYFDTIFKVGDEYYQGTVNIENNAKGRRLKDITQIKNITQDICSSYGINPKSTFLRDTSVNSIRDSSENYNPSNEKSQNVNYPAPFGIDPVAWGRRVRMAEKATTELAKTAVLYNVDERAYAAAERLAKETGAKIVFDDTLRWNEEGCYQNGVIHLNPRVEETFPVVFAHELLHHLENTKLYTRLESHVLSQYGDLDQAIEEKKEEYLRRSKGKEKLNDKRAKAELVASYISKNLFSNPEAIVRLANKDLTIAGKIRDFCSRMAARVTGDREKWFLLRAKRLYEKAIEQAKKDVNKSAKTAGRANFLAETADVDSKAENRYAGKSLSTDSTIYSYDFLTNLPDMTVTILPEVSAIINSDEKVDTHKVVGEGMKNAHAVGTERDGKVFVRNNYTGKELRIDVSSIRHGLNGRFNRLLTNARLGAVIGDVVKNAVPINALHNKAAGVTGTYAMAAYASDGQEREFVAIVTVEQHSGSVADIEVYDVTHAVSGRQKNGQASDPHMRSREFTLSNLSKISIADFLKIINTTHQSILSEDVLRRLGETRNPEGEYADQVKFSLKSAETDRDTAGRIDKATQLLDNGAAPSEVYTQTGLVVMANGDIYSGIGGEKIGVYQRGGTESDQGRVERGAQSVLSRHIGAGNRGALAGTEASVRRKGWEELGNNEKQQITSAVERHMERAPEEGNIFLERSGGIEDFTQRFYSMLQQGRVTAEKWADFIPDIQGLMDEIESIASEDTGGRQYSLSPEKANAPDSGFLQFIEEYSRYFGGLDDSFYIIAPYFLDDFVTSGNQPASSYDLETDPIYQAYQKQYAREERRAAYERKLREAQLAAFLEDFSLLQQMGNDLNPYYLTGKAVANPAEDGTIKNGETTISSIERPIEQRHTGKGNPNAIIHFDRPLNDRQQRLLEQLPTYNARIIVPWESVSMPDLSALSAKTGDEFALFTKGNERLVIRGNPRKVNIHEKEALELAAQGYRWSGHTHPGTDMLCLQASEGDVLVLNCFKQESSVIYNAKEEYRTFYKDR